MATARKGAERESPARTAQQAEGESVKGRRIPAFKWAPWIAVAVSVPLACGGGAPKFSEQHFDAVVQDGADCISQVFPDPSSAPSAPDDLFVPQAGDPNAEQYFGCLEAKGYSCLEPGVNSDVCNKGNDELYFNLAESRWRTENHLPTGEQASPSS